MSTTIEAREKIEAEEPAALSEIDAGLAQQARPKAGSTSFASRRSWSGRFRGRRWSTPRAG